MLYFILYFSKSYLQNDAKMLFSIARDNKILQKIWKQTMIKIEWPATFDFIANLSLSRLGVNSNGWDEITFVFGMKSLKYKLKCNA